MAQSRYYSSAAVPTTLAASMNASQTTATISAAIGLPGTTPFVMALGYGSATEELVLVNSIAGTNLTSITRGFDGTVATSHTSGDAVRHVWCGADGNDSRSHEGATSAVHGVTGSVVGTTDVQTLTSKTLTSPSINSGSVSGTFTGTPTFSGNVSINNKISQSLTLVTDTAHGSLVSGDTFDRYRQYADGKLEWGPGTATRDTNLYRASAGVAQSDSLLSLTPTSTAVVDYFKVNAPAGASTSAGLLNLTNNTGNRFSVSTTGQVNINKTGNVAGVPLLIVAESGQTGNLITTQVAASPIFTVNAAGAALFGGGTAVIGSTGTFTTYANNTASTYTPAVGGGGTATFSTQSGRYYKVGKMVFVTLKIVVNVAGSGASNVTVDMPSIVDGTVDQVILCHFQPGASTRTGYGIKFSGTNSATLDRIRAQDGGATNAVSNVTGVDLVAGTVIAVSGWYMEA